MSPEPPTTRDVARDQVRERLLDAAEALFADRGYAGASVRDITQQAGVRLAAVSDAFGGKEQLFRAVLLRRILPLNDDRRAALDRLDDDGAADLEAVVRAFTEPMLERSGQGEGWACYFRFVAQLASSAHPVQRLVGPEYNEIAGVFVERLHRLHPHATPARVLEAYLLMVAAGLQVFSGNRRFEHLSGDPSGVGDRRARHESLVRFLVGGIDGLLRDEG